MNQPTAQYLLPATIDRPLESWMNLTESQREALDAVASTLRYVAITEQQIAGLRALAHIGAADIWPSRYGGMGAGLTNRGRALLATRQGNARLCPDCGGTTHSHEYQQRGYYAVARMTCPTCTNGVLVSEDAAPQVVIAADAEAILAKPVYTRTEAEVAILAEFGVDLEAAPTFQITRDRARIARIKARPYYRRLAADAAYRQKLAELE